MTTSQLDTVAQPAWRGVAPEDVEEVTASLGTLLRHRTRRLLLSLVRPRTRPLVIGGLLLLVHNLASMAGPYLVEVGIDRGIPPLVAHRGAGVLGGVILAYLGATAIRVVAFRGFIKVSGRMGQDFLFDLRTRLFDHFQRLSLSFHEHYTSGRVTSRLTSDIEAITELLDTGLQSLVTAALSIASTLVILLVLDLPLGLTTLVVFSGVVGLTRWFRNHSTRAYRASRTTVALVIVHFVESLGGIRVVHAFRREARNREIMDDVNGRYCDANAWSMRIAGVYGPGVRFLGHLAMAAVLLYGGHRVIRHDMTVGALAAFTLYLRKVFDPMQEMSQFYNTFQAAAAALEKLAGVLEEEPKVAEPAQPRSVPRPRGEVRLEHVSFAYREDVVLHDVDIVIPAGQTVALVGATGAGKSTVARLIARFYDPTVGRVTLDGVDLRLVSEDDMRRAVGMVTQEGFLFTGTIADNIAFGRPEAKRNELVAAAEAIGAHRFIARLPEGYDTDVAKRGGRLSAGQRQLISFARAFLADPRVLILDEATSSLDVPSERLVQRALRTLLADRTAVIIAHRLTTVEIADRLLVIDAGGVVEDGSAAELMGRDSHYRALHQAWQKSLA
jgi:ABC-type multidrug transport system fused ATPase/permease subunit